MFVTVKYGDNDSRLFNANCKNGVLLEHIKSRCKCQENDTVELSDETGAVKNLRCHPHDYATDYLKERETLVLLRVERYSNEGTDTEDKMLSARTRFFPLLKSARDSSEFIANLNPKLSQQSLSSKGNRRRSSVKIDTDEATVMKIRNKNSARRLSLKRGSLKTNTLKFK